MTGRRSHGRLSALNGVVHQGTVDVERALFTLADSQATDKARVLLDGPAGWTFDRR